MGSIFPRFFCFKVFQPWQVQLKRLLYVTLKKTVIGILIFGCKGTTRRRYTENSQIIASVGAELAEGEDDALTKKVDGELDIDLAELSLGQRLTTLTGVSLDERLSDSEGDKDDVNRRPRVSRSGKTTNGEERLSIPIQSLSRTLVQALHSNDTRLLELCLMHTNPPVVLNTVKRLPPQLAVPLLLACVERLGRGARAGTGKGGGAGASSQRGTGLIRWIRAVLVVHTAHLVTVRQFCFQNMRWGALFNV